ncbi:MAG: hypothetical protein J1F18_03510 [Lachnospiraceae bacterium]|nr:hypothetical protein [Lachnospiraceae bacterium]
MKKIITKMYLFCMAIILVIIIRIGSQIIEQEENIANMTKQNEELEKQYNQYVQNYNEARELLSQYEKESRALLEKLNYQKEITNNTDQSFIGWWAVDDYYNNEWLKSSWVRFYDKRIQINSTQSTEPVYQVRLIRREELIEILQQAGVDDEEIIDMLDADYYGEMDFSNSYGWEEESDMDTAIIKEMKFYPIKWDKMLGISQNDGGRVYVAGRMTRF